MTTLHIDKEESDIFLLNRKKRESESELEKLHKETIPDIPLSKALYLLANVHGQVFDKAISTIRQSSPLELSVKVGECNYISSLSLYFFASNCAHYSSYRQGFAIDRKIS